MKHIQIVGIDHKIYFSDAVRQVYAANSIDNTTVIPRQNDIEDFFELGFDFYVKSIIRG